MHARPALTQLTIALFCASVGFSQSPQLRYFVDGSIPGARWGDCLSSASDLDGDGLVDFVAGSRLGCSVQDYVSAIRGSDGSVLWSLNHTGSSCDHFGTVELIGDLDGDGISDMVVGAPQANGNRGQAHIISTQTLATLHVINAAGTAPDDRFGSSTGRLGDITGDGIPEFTVAASSADPCCGHYVGTVQAFDGATFAPIWQANGSAGYDYAKQKLGKDINGDGIREVTWHSQQDGFSPQGPGYVRLLDGATGAEIFRVDGVNIEDHFGDQWCLLDDVDGDGTFDFALAVPLGDSIGTNLGEIQVRSGADLTVLHVTPLLPCTPFIQIGGESGGSICELPDLDGDGAPEFAVGQERAQLTAGDPATAVGAVAIVSGATGAVLDTLWGDEPSGRFGRQVRTAEGLGAAGDLSLVVSAPWHSAEAGRVYVYDLTPPDCNGNGIPDPSDISSGTSADCDGNGVPDECDLASGSASDCNGNGSPDSCDIAAGLELDCNLNGIPDSCDLLAGTSLDCDANGIPDECDIAAGVADCNADGTPDTCQIAADATLDLNANGTLDACEAIGNTYCSPAVANSTGVPGEVTLLGSDLIVLNQFFVSARQLPANSFGFFIASTTPGSVNPVPNSQGTLCVIGDVGRGVGGGIFNAGPEGAHLSYANLLNMPQPNGAVAVLAGETWNFQAWYRDAVGGQTTSNFTDAVAVTFQ